MAGRLSFHHQDHRTEEEAYDVRVRDCHALPVEAGQAPGDGDGPARLLLMGFSAGDRGGQLRLRPSRRAITAITNVVPNYVQASRFSANNLSPFLYDTGVTPHWIGKTDSFWYAFQSSAGTKYYRVNPKLGEKEPLFVRDKLGDAASATSRSPWSRPRCRYPSEHQ